MLKRSSRFACVGRARHHRTGRTIIVVAGSRVTANTMWGTGFACVMAGVFSGCLLRPCVSHCLACHEAVPKWDWSATDHKSKRDSEDAGRDLHRGHCIASAVCIRSASRVGRARIADAIVRSLTGLQPRGHNKR